VEVWSKMRHRVDGRLFGRTANQRKALLRGLVASLFEHQRIETTVPKAKEIRRIAEKMITQNDLPFLIFLTGQLSRSFSAR
jgi:ribosomal protein L17